MADDVALKINGQAFGGWTSVQVRRSLAHLAPPFSLGVVERWPGLPERRTIRKGQACQVSIGEVVLITGWIDDRSSTVAAGTTGRTIKVSGRDKTCDLVDCSAVGRPSSWKNQKLERIATDLIKPFGLSLTVAADTGAAFAAFAIEQGEDVFSALTRACRMRGVLLGTDNLANVVIFKPSRRLLQGSLDLGRNIKAISVNDSALELFSTYIVKGQCQGGDDVSAKDAAGPQGTANDPGVTRYRPLMIVSDDQATRKGLQNRAAWEATVRSAKAQSVSVTVAGFRDEAGDLWEPGAMIPVHAASENVDMTLMIADATFTVDENGKTTVLTLVRPQAFTVETLPEAKTKKNKKDGAFDALDEGAIHHTVADLTGNIDKTAGKAKVKAETLIHNTVADLLGIGKKGAK